MLREARVGSFAMGPIAVGGWVNHMVWAVRGWVCIKVLMQMNMRASNLYMYYE